MSEYQYYEFLAVDRLLSEKEIEQVREYSSRAEISSTRFVNEYNWGNFRGDPDKFLDRWFDLMVYVANWGTQRLMIALPIDAVDDRQAWRGYEGEFGLEIRTTKRRIILDFTSELEEPEDWTEGERWMASLAPVREELLGGDTRPLFLGWLAGIASEEPEDDLVAPPVPAGLSELTPAQRTLADFLRVDEDLLSVIALESPARAAPPDQLARWIAALPVEEKDRMLLSAASGEDPRLSQTLLRRYRQSLPRPPAPQRASVRTVGAWLRDAAARRDAREAAARERAARARERKKAEQAAAREKHLADLASRQEQAWTDVQRLIGSKQQNAYDQAVATLSDLREVAIRADALDRFAAAVARLRQEHHAKHTLVQRLRKSGLLEE